MSDKGIEAYKKAIKVSKKAADTIVEEIESESYERSEKGVVFVAAMAQLAGRMMVAIEKTYGVPHEVLMQGIELEYECSKDSLKSFNIGLN